MLVYSAGKLLLSLFFEILSVQYSERGSTYFISTQIEHEEFSLKLWISSLNALTWTEILRQVLVAAGFGSKHGRVPQEALSKVLQLLSTDLIVFLHI